MLTRRRARPEFVSSVSVSVSRPHPLHSLRTVVLAPGPSHRTRGLLAEQMMVILTTEHAALQLTAHRRPPSTSIRAKDLPLTEWWPLRCIRSVRDSKELASCGTRARCETEIAAGASNRALPTCAMVFHTADSQMILRGLTDWRREGQRNVHG